MRRTEDYKDEPKLRGKRDEGPVLTENGGRVNIRSLQK